jgi:hypothetical protein
MSSQDRKFSRHRFKVAIVTIFATLFLIVAPTAAASGFCEAKTVGNWVQPLEQLPALRNVPADRRLPFGPRGVYLYPGHESQILLPDKGSPLEGGASVGYVLKIPYRSANDGNPNLPRLNWLLTTKLAQVDRHGNAIKTLHFWRRHITGPSSNGGFQFEKPHTIGLYRVEIVFRNAGGKRLARFGEYFRVAPPVTDVRLVLNAASYRPGETISACLENYGTTGIFYGGCVGGSGSLFGQFSIQAFDGSAWRRSPIDPGGPCADVGLALGPAGVASAGTFTIPTNAPAGLYRAVLSGGEITAEFHIEAASS